MSVIKRPGGVTLIAILWVLGGLISIGSGLVSVSADITGLSYLSGYGLDPWFSYAIPLELLISIIVTIVGLVQLVAAAGLWSGKKFAYRFALALPIISIITNLTLAGMYFSSPVDIQYNFSSTVFGIGSAVFWLIIYFSYFNKQHVKIWLKVVPAPVAQPYYGQMQYPPAQPVNGVPPPTMQQQNHYCRYCGAPNKADAKFCGQCGQQLTG